MPIDTELLSLTCCPESHQSLSEVDEGSLKKLNERIQAGDLRNIADEVITESLEGGLLREDGKRLYPILQGIPLLLSEHGIVVPEGVFQ